MLKHATSPCRIRFARRDFDFVAEALAAHGKRCHLAKLWKDPEGLRELLDLGDIFRNLVESPSSIQVSPSFYFYVLVRQTFVKNGLSNADLADYVSQLMARRVSAEESDPLEDLTGHFTRVSDFLGILSKTRGRIRRQLHIAAANQFLLLTGLYPGFLKHRHEKGETPDLDFYVAFARKAYRAASRCKVLTPSEGMDVHATLAEALPDVRRSLNQLSEELVFLGA
jgi:hypothetical protein